jgi:hypothetical protein
VLDISRFFYGINKIDFLTTILANAVDRAAQRLGRDMAPSKGRAA